MKWKSLALLGVVAAVAGCTPDLVEPIRPSSPSFAYGGTPASFNSTWFQGFEIDAIDWTATTRVPSGTNGVTSSTGAYHGEATTGAFTRFNAYSSVWPGDYTTEVDVYLDPAWAVGQGFDYSVATNGITNTHRRDFIFHVGVTSPGGLRVYADNNTYGGGVPNAFILNSAGSVEITTAGWYKLQHIFYVDGGVLAVDLRLLNSSGIEVYTTTRKDLTDLIGVDVGGNRYGWFIFSTRTLAIDNHRRATAAPQSPSTTSLTITPSSPVFGTGGNNVLGVSSDAAPGFASGSFASNGLLKSDIYLPPEALFEGREISVGQVARMSYWTKTGTTHAVNPADWFMLIYTKPFTGDVSTPTWYGSRFGAEPYFSASLLDPANTWNNWSTNLAPNRLRFFESTAGAPGANFGSYTDPHWASFIAGNSLGTTVHRASQQILFFSIQTGSGWASGFTGQVDGLRIELTDGSVATVNFEPTAPPAVSTAAANALGTEGQTLTTSGAFTGSGLTLTANNSVGTFTPNNAAGTWTWSLATTDDVATATITVTATDGLGQTASDHFDYGATNVAPTLTVTAPAAGTLYALGIATSLTSTFTDPGSADTHTCTVAWDDGTTAGPSTSGVGTCNASRTYTAPGVYTISVTVTDDNGGSDTETVMVIVYDPTAGFVTGGGWFDSPAGAYTPGPTLTGRATFGFVSRYVKGKALPTGNTQFQFKAGDLNFSSTSYEWLVVSGARAQFRGAGTINGDGDYRFMLTVIDGQISGGGGTDKFRIRIWDDVGLVYDNQLNAPDSATPTTVLGGGSIVIHVPKK